MICPNCQNKLPDGVLFCNLCGSAAMIYEPPEGFELDPESQRYYRSEIAGDGMLWVTWFDANSGEYEQVSYPAEPHKFDLPPIPAGPKPRKPTPEPIRQETPLPIPEGFTLNEHDGLYYIKTNGTNENGLHFRHITSFNPHTGEYKQKTYPVNPGAGAEKTNKEQDRPKKSGFIMALPIVVLLIGIGIAFLQSGGFSLFQSGTAAGGIELTDLDNTPGPVFQSADDIVSNNIFDDIDFDSEPDGDYEADLAETGPQADEIVDEQGEQEYAAATDNDLKDVIFIHPLLEEAVYGTTHISTDLEISDYVVWLDEREDYVCNMTITNIGTQSVLAYLWCNVVSGDGNNFVSENLEFGEFHLTRTNSRTFDFTIPSYWVFNDKCEITFVMSGRMSMIIRRIDNIH